ncbi:MAG: phosphorylase [Synechococcales bacterium]|nr:phosphorylase [Synechococcales bacterium]
MAEASPILPAGTLWDRVLTRTEQALQCGALQSIPTDYELVADGEMRFLVRQLAAIARKEKAKQQQEKAKAQGKDFNPFLPYEEDLFVAHLSNTHVCLLNKFNVVDHHLLMVTRQFEEQEALLNQADFEALWVGLREIDGLGFYNGGQRAGASQRHKHLQLVPLPLYPTGEPLPISVWVEAIAPDRSPAVLTLPQLPFPHALVRLAVPQADPTAAAQISLEHYQALLAAVGLTPEPESDRPPGAYNLLVTRDWMLLVPRSQESFDSISVNSLGFAGSMFVRDDAQMATLKQHGPLKILCQVAQSGSADGGNVKGE